MVERHLAKVNVASSNLVFRSNMQMSYNGNTSAFQAEAAGSIPAICSTIKNPYEAPTCSAFSVAIQPYGYVGP